MPELPEVELCARLLRRALEGRTLREVAARPGTPLRDLTPEGLTAGLTGRRVDLVRRHGKQLFLEVSDGHVLLLHLGMTGKVRRASQLEAPADRVLFVTDEGERLVFTDSRRFGRVRLLSTEDAARHPEICDLGPDALALCDRPEELHRALLGTRRSLKETLLDQRRLAGVGNIYASEALFGARISPRRVASSVTAEEATRLAVCLREAFRATLDAQEGEVVAYLNEGEIDNPFRVYAREAEPCPDCGTPIRREVQGGRSTFSCPSCQPDPPADP